MIRRWIWILGKLIGAGRFWLAHWTYPQYEGQVIHGQTTTNCDSIALTLNDNSFGTRKTCDYANNTIDWYVTYEKGEIVAKGHKGGQAVTYKLRTAGEAAEILLSADRKQTAADGQDLSHVVIKLVDEQGGGSKC